MPFVELRNGIIIKDVYCDNITICNGTATLPSTTFLSKNIRFSQGVGIIYTNYTKTLNDAPFGKITLELGLYIGIVVLRTIPITMATIPGPG
jgi:hypothetical protein